MKAFLKPNHIPISKFKFEIALVIGELQFVSLTLPELELDVAELPDRTFATGGRAKPQEFSGMLPTHHKAEQAFMEAWLLAAQDPVQPLYKRPVIIRQISLEETVADEAIWTLEGVFPFKRKGNDLDANNDGELSVVEWTFKADNVFRVL